MLTSKHRVHNWAAQSVTVGYEQAGGYPGQGRKPRGADLFSVSRPPEGVDGLTDRAVSAAGG